MTETRCDAIVLQVIVTAYDESGRPVSERVSQPVKVFRAMTEDVWAEVDRRVAALKQTSPV
jgi:hypothetical protein